MLPIISTNAISEAKQRLLSSVCLLLLFSLFLNEEVVEKKIRHSHPICVYADIYSHSQQQQREKPVLCKPTATKSIRHGEMSSYIHPPACLPACLSLGWHKRMLYDDGRAPSLERASKPGIDFHPKYDYHHHGYYHYYYHYSSMLHSVLLCSPTHKHTLSLYTFVC